MRSIYSAFTTLYAINALCQILIVRIFVPYFLAWLFVRLLIMFPKQVFFLGSRMYAFFDSVPGVTEGISQHWIGTFLAMGNVMEAQPVFRDLRSALKMAFLAEGMMLSLLGEVLSSIPHFFVIPTEISKCYILTNAVKSYHLGNVGSRCRNIVIMAVAVSMPIANVEVVSSPHLAADVFGQDEWSKLRLSFRFLAIMGMYASSMLSCVMLGVRIAENAILKRKHRMWTVRVMSFVFIWLVQVLTWLSSVDGVLAVSQQAMISCTLLVILNGTGLYLWLRVLLLIGDEQFTLRESNAQRQAVSRPTS